MIKVLNLYAGIGDNRKLWGGVDVTAVEINPKIAQIYEDFFPKDEVIVADAHQYLLNHFAEFDFIWSSPPCPSHSKLRKSFSYGVGAKPIYPSMDLYAEIIFLEGYFKGKWVVENVQSYYNPLIRPSKLERHYIWANFIIPENRLFKSGGIRITGGYNEKKPEQVKRLAKLYGYDLDKLGGNKILLLRNCVLPKLGRYIFDYAFKVKQQKIGD